jgi:hypothetical protein
LGLIALLSEICDCVSGQVSKTTVEEQDDYKSHLKILDWRIRNMTIAVMENEDADAPLTRELFRLAMLVYLHRASENLLNQWPRTQQHIDRAFATLAQLGSCDRQFPVFILGCEARSDEQRAVVLDLIARTEGGVSSRSFRYVQVLLQAMWAQDDLANGDIKHVKYWDKLTHVISGCRNLPTFV